MITFTNAPEKCPYSASKPLVNTRNSCSESSTGITLALFPVVFSTLPPFTRKPLAFSRPPLTETLPVLGFDGLVVALMGETPA